MEMIGQLHALATLPRGKSPPYPTNERLGGPKSQFRHGGKENPDDDNDDDDDDRYGSPHT
jgi:hypothetical protein